MNNIEALKKKRKFTNLFANINFAFLLYQGIGILMMAQSGTPIPADVGVGAAVSFAVYWLMKSESEKTQVKIDEIEGKNERKSL